MLLVWNGVSQYNWIKAKISLSGGDGGLLLQTPGCCVKVSTSHSSNLTLGSVQDQLGLQATGSWRWPLSWLSLVEEPEQQQKGRRGEEKQYKGGDQTRRRRCKRNQTEEVQKQTMNLKVREFPLIKWLLLLLFPINPNQGYCENTSKSYFNFHSSAEPLSKYTHSTTAIYFHSVLLAGLNSHTLAQTLLQN